MGVVHPSNPATGAFFFDSSTGVLEVWDGASWRSVGASGGAGGGQGTSCNAIKQASPSSLNGIYAIDPDGAGPITAFNAYCDMTTAGGGWTLCLSNVERGKGVAIADANDWWTTVWDKGTRVFTRGNKTSGTAWGNFCPLLASSSTQIYASVYSEGNVVTVGDTCNFNPSFFSANAGYVNLSCGGSTRMASIPKSNFGSAGCTGCIFWSDEWTPNVQGTVWGHSFYGTHVMVRLLGASAYGPSGIHWGYVNPGMSNPSNGGDVHCGSNNGWCFEAYWGGHVWSKSMQLYMR